MHHAHTSQIKEAERQYMYAATEIEGYRPDKP